MTLAAAVRQAIADAPWSLRALARAAGLPHAKLVRIRHGTAAVTPDVAKRIAAALERWGGRCTRDSTRIRTALRGPEGSKR